jgi:hypothetical protein
MMVTKWLPDCSFSFLFLSEDEDICGISGDESDSEGAIAYFAC